jgi:hypothetical protein
MNITSARAGTTSGERVNYVSDSRPQWVNCVSADSHSPEPRCITDSGQESSGFVVAQDAADSSRCTAIGAAGRVFAKMWL